LWRIQARFMLPGIGFAAKCPHNANVRRFMRPIFTALLLAALSIIGGPAAASECLPWSIARPLIAKHDLVPPHVVYHRIQSRIRGQIIHAVLCQQGNRFFYKFAILSPKGDVQIIAVDARTGR
jgi:hypothetical protein